MEAVFGLLAVLAGVSHGLETYMYCDARLNGAQCYGGLGGTVNLQLMAEEEEKYDYYLKKNDINISKRKGNKTVIDDSVKNRLSVTLGNGTLRMSDIRRSDGGEYLLEIANEDGLSLVTRRIQMSTEAPVSFPRLSSDCHHGNRRVSCSSEGDVLQYSWTLDGYTLRDTELLFGNNETRNITLRRGLSGKLACSVKNHVNSATDTQNILQCEGVIFINCTVTNGSHMSDWVLEADKIECSKTTTVAPTTVTSPEATTKGYIIIIAGSLAAVVLILLVAVGVYCAQMKKKVTKAPDNEDDQDVTYADVRILQGQQRQKEKWAEMKVEYGQVNVSGWPRQTAESSEDDCVYAKVRVGQ